MIRTVAHKAYYIIIPILVIGISLGYTGFGVSLLALIPLLFMSNRHTVAIYLVMYGGAVAGIIRATYPSIPIYGLFVEVLGIVLMWDLIKDLFSKHSKAVIGVVFVLLFFGVFYLMGPQTSFARVKYRTMWTHGLFMLVGFFALDRSSKIDVEGLSRLLLVSSLCVCAYVIQTASMSGGGLFEYNWFRQQAIVYERVNDDSGGLLVGYQQFGMLVLFSLSVFASQIKIKPLCAVFYSICCTQLVLVSGCRQAILGVVLVIALRFVVFRYEYVYGMNKLKHSFGVTAGLVIAYYLILFFLEHLNSDVVNMTLREGDQGRIALYMESLAIFRDHILVGSGIGGYNAITGNPWPHNFILELLCETGLIGTLVAFMFLILPLVWKRLGLLHVTASNQFYFLVLFATFVRVMFSGDLRISIELFSAVLAISSVTEYGKRIIKN